MDLIRRWFGNWKKPSTKIQPTEMTVKTPMAEMKFAISEEESLIQIASFTDIERFDPRVQEVLRAPIYQISGGDRIARIDREAVVESLKELVLKVDVQIEQALDAEQENQLEEVATKVRALIDLARDEPAEFDKWLRQEVFRQDPV